MLRLGKIKEEIKLFDEAGHCREFNLSFLWPHLICALVFETKKEKGLIVFVLWFLS